MEIELTEKIKKILSSDDKKIQKFRNMHNDYKEHRAIYDELIELGIIEKKGYDIRDYGTMFDF